MALIGSISPGSQYVSNPASAAALAPEMAVAIEYWSPSPKMPIFMMFPHIST
jgi:hypothetical protein